MLKANLCQRFDHCLWLLPPLVALLAGCPPVKPPPPNGDPDLVALGEKLFFNETFNGNGRTCGTCHRAEDNFGLTTAFIASLPDDDPLFVAETRPALANGFENPVLMRELALIVENQDGFDDLATNFNMRGIPHTLGMNNSIASIDGPRTGWSGDGAPGDFTLRSFAVGAVIQHFPLTTARIAGVDFRLPTDEELDALEAFQLSLGPQEELALPLPLKGDVALRGQELFNDLTTGKCSACHLNAGANANPALFQPGVGNKNFNTGVEALPDQPADLTGELVPPDDGFGAPGNGEFNTPTLISAADTSPFFHNNSVETIEGAVAFYNGEAFNNSPAGQLVIAASGSGINLEVTQVIAVAAFLRVINALDNIRETLALLEKARLTRFQLRDGILPPAARAWFEAEDAAQVLAAGGLHPIAAQHLNAARSAIEQARDQRSYTALDTAIEHLQSARSELISDE